MKFGIYLPNFGPMGNPHVLADLATDAETAGWDGFFIWDHIVRKPEFSDVTDAWVALSAIAMRTKTIRIGALVTPLARRRPWKVARETVAVDQLSNGRLVFGAGLGSAGGSQLEWENFGEVSDLRQRGEMLDEGLAILAGLWSGQFFNYQGKHYQVGDSQFLPMPVQQPRIPIWVAGTWPNKLPFKRAARWDGVVPLFNGENEPEQLKMLVNFIAELGTDMSHFDVVCQGITSAENGSEQVSLYQANGVTWWLEDLLPTYFGDDWKTSWHVEAIRERILQGPPKS